MSGEAVQRRFDGAYGAFYDAVVSRRVGLRAMGLAFGSQQPAASIARLVREAYADAPEEPLLDAPCGAISSLVHARGVRREGEVVGVDLVDGMLERAKRRLVDVEPEYPVRFVLADACAMPFEDDVFGAALSINGIHCLPDPRAFVTEVARVLRPGGTFTFTTLAAERGAYAGVAIAAFTRTNVIPGPPPTVDELDAMLDTAGFDVFERIDGRSLVARRCRLR